VTFKRPLNVNACTGSPLYILHRSRHRLIKMRFRESSARFPGSAPHTNASGIYVICLLLAVDLQRLTGRYTEEPTPRRMYHNTQLCGSLASSEIDGEAVGRVREPRVVMLQKNRIKLQTNVCDHHSASSGMCYDVIIKFRHRAICTHT
jgi:hypothetical protein